MPRSSSFRIKETSFYARRSARGRGRTPRPDPPSGNRDHPAIVASRCARGVQLAQRGHGIGINTGDVNQGKLLPAGRLQVYGSIAVDDPTRSGSATLSAVRSAWRRQGRRLGPEPRWRRCPWSRIRAITTSQRREPTFPERGSEFTASRNAERAQVKSIRGAVDRRTRSPTPGSHPCGSPSPPSGGRSGAQWIAERALPPPVHRASRWGRRTAAAPAWGAGSRLRGGGAGDGGAAREPRPRYLTPFSAPAARCSQSPPKAPPCRSASARAC